MRLGHRSGRWYLVDAHGGRCDVTDIVGTPNAAGGWSSWCARLAGTTSVSPSSAPGEPSPPDEVFDCPIVAPSTIVGLLGNDSGRAEESGGGVDFFVKASSSIVGPSGAIRYPSPDLIGTGRRVVPECELAVVIARDCRDVGTDEAMGHVLGYTVALDLAVRGPGERSRRKSLPTFAPLGPVLVTADEVPDPNHLDVSLRIGDALVQDWSTSQMVLDVAAVVSWVSRWVDLNAGDVVLCGAPSVSAEVAVGDVCTAEISGIGVLSLPVVG